MAEKSIHMVFGESNNGILSEGFNELNLNKHFGDVSDIELDANDQNKVRRRIYSSQHKVSKRLKKNWLSALKTSSLILRSMLMTWKDNLNILVLTLQLKTPQ